MVKTNVKSSKRIIKSGINLSMKTPVKLNKLKGEAEFYKYLWKNNNGIFYRGISGGKGLSVSLMGQGTYVAWDIKVADSFAKMSAEQHGKKPDIIKFKLSKDLKLLDYQSDTRWNIWKSLGISDRWIKISDPLFANIVSKKIKSLGFDGVISDDPFDGILIFDENKLKKITDNKNFTICD